MRLTEISLAIDRRLALVVSSFAAITVACSAQAQNSRNELPIPASPEDDLTAIQRAFKPPPPPPLTLFPRLREQVQDLPPFLRDATFDFNPRSYYRDVVTSSPDKVTVKEAWAAGGSAAFETGRLFDVISGGVVFYASLPLYAPLQYDGTDLLLPGQLGYDVVGQLYGKLHLSDNLSFTAGRYLYDTPYLGPNDTRMTPNTFYGYSLIGKGGDEGSVGPSFRYGAGYIAAIKLRNANTFQSMSRAAGANTDNGVGVAGAFMNWGPAYIGAVEYYCQDTLNIAYLEGKYGHKLSPDISAILAVQYADQRSTGANLTNGGVYFQTNQFGSRLRAWLPDRDLHAGLFGREPQLPDAESLERQPGLHKRDDPELPAGRRKCRGGRRFLCLHADRSARPRGLHLLLSRLDYRRCRPADCRD